MKKKVEHELKSDTDKVIKEIGAKIRLHRKSLWKNYESFSQEKNLNKVTVSKIENGDEYLLRNLIICIHSLDMTLEDFFRGIK